MPKQTEIVVVAPHHLPKPNKKDREKLPPGRPAVLGSREGDVLCLPPTGNYSATQRRQDGALRGQVDAVQMAIALVMSNSMLAAHGRAPSEPKGETLKAIEGDNEAMLLAKDRTGRHLFSPQALRTKPLLSYCNRLAPLAFVVSKEPVSIHMARPLLNAANWRNVQDMAEQVLELYQVENADPLPPDTLSDIAALSGFTTKLFHPGKRTIQVESCNPQEGEELEDYVARLTLPQYKIVQNHNGNYNEGQRWIREVVPEAEGFAEWLIRTGDVYGSAMFRRVENQKVAAVRDAHLAWMEEMTSLTRSRLKDHWESLHREPFGEVFEYTNQDFQRAVNMVFYEPWSRLDVSGQPGSILRDKEVVLARALLGRLAKAANLSSTKPRPLPGPYFLALSLLTGVPITSWVRFAVDDLRRRGEGFIRSQTFDELMDAIELSELTVYLTGELRDELSDLRWELEQVDREADAPWASVLRKGKGLLWTRGPSPYHETVGKDGDVEYTMRPDKRLSML